MQKVNQPSFTSTSQILIIHTNVSKKTFARLNFNLRQLLYSLIWTVREQVNMHSSRVDFFYGSVCFHCNTCGDNPPSVQKCGIWSWSVASAIANQVDIFRSLIVCWFFFLKILSFFYWHRLLDLNRETLSGGTQRQKRYYFKISDSNNFGTHFCTKRALWILSLSAH